MEGDSSFPVAARWVDGRKKGSKILLDPDSYRMRYKSSKNRTGYYVCAKKKELGCQVRLTLDEDEDLILSLNGIHCHENNLLQNVTSEFVKAEMNKISEQHSITPVAAKQELCMKVLGEKSIGAAGLSYMPSLNVISKKLSRKRKADLDLPPLAKSWEDLVVPESLKKTPDGSDFLILEETVSDGKKVWGFSSPTMLQLLSSSNEWSLDGTWDICKATMFEQVWVAVAKVDPPGINLPCAFFLLPNKQPESYTLALEALMKKEVSPPAVVHVDFERAEHKAIRKLMPESRIVTCLVHWHRALREKLADLKMMSMYNQDITLQVFFRKLRALCFVPEDEVIVTYETLIEDVPTIDEEEEDQMEFAMQCNAKMDKYLLYFSRTWIGMESRKKGNPRGKPMFPIALWNKRAEALDEEELTSNASESWNSVSKNCLPMKPNVFVVVEAFRKEDGLARARVIEAANGSYVDPNPGRTARLRRGRREWQRQLGLMGSLP